MRYADMTPEQKAKKLEAKRRYRKNNPDKNRQEKRRYAEKHPDARRERARRQRQSNPDRFREKKLRYYAKHPEVRKAERLRRVGFTLADHSRAIALQHNRCAICGTDFVTLPAPQVHADHDHATGLPRGVLCAPCNTGLGMFKDSPERLLAAIRYLEHPPLSLV